MKKPRTTIGWKGLINDPLLNNSFDITLGLKTARKLLLDITYLGLPVATELLDPIVPQYISNLLSWCAIGARTTESQTHREMASGLSMPVGFKNGTDGNIQIAIDAIKSSNYPHTFFGINQQGNASIVKTKGNPWAHLVLRGGNDSPNYQTDFIKSFKSKLEASKVSGSMIVDCSHGNSLKQHKNQKLVWDNVISQKLAGETSLIGLMLESHLFEGQQKLQDQSQLKYGVSITDACIGWEETEELVLSTFDKLP